MMTHAEWLIDRSVGKLSPEFNVVLDCYLALNPQEQEAAALLDRVGGEYLANVPEQELKPGTRESVLARIGEPEQRAGVTPLPAPLRALIDGDPKTVRWRRLLPWLAVHRVPVSNENEEATGIWLLKIGSGHSIPSHSHRGEEMSLVLQGGYSDTMGSYRRGDLSVVNHTVDHKPVADPGEPCVVLVAYDQPLSLTGPFGRIIERFRSAK